MTLSVDRLRLPVVGVVAICVGALLFPNEGFAQTALLRKAAQEIFEMVGKKLGREGAQELAEKVGREGVEEILERAAKEGGEEAVERVVRVGGSHGAKALRILERAPAQLSRALDDLPANQVKQALSALEREPELLTGLASKYGARGLSLELRHPGVGGKLLAKLGDDALSVGQRLTTDQIGRVTHYADDIAKLPATQRKAFLDALAKTPGKVLDALETHPTVLKAMTAVGIVLPVGMKAVEGEAEEVRPDGTRVTTKGLLGGGSIFLQAVGEGIGSGVKWALIIASFIVGIAVAGFLTVWLCSMARKHGLFRTAKRIRSENEKD